MKIINLGILGHVDAGKTTLTESLLYTSGAIAELGSVDEGTTRTDTMNLERQRGITIQTAVTSFQWEDVKVNIIDTPGHMDFLAEVYRSLSVLDGAVLLVSAKDGIQAQTRILFHALQIMKIPTIFFINKIDQEGIDLPMVYREMKAKLSSEIIVKQKVGQHPHINVTDNDDMEQWDAVIMGNDELLEKYMSGKPFKMSELEQEENRRFQNGTLFPVYHGSAKNNLGIRQLIEVITINSSALSMNYISYLQNGGQQCPLKIVRCAALNMSRALVHQGIVLLVPRRYGGRNQTRANAGAENRKG